MSRQIRFLLLNGDETEFVKLVTDFGDTKVDDKGKELTTEEALRPEVLGFYIVSSQSIIVKDKKYGFITPDLSDAIEFSRSIVCQPGCVRFGRLWVKLDYWGENGKKIRKEKWLNDKYNIYKKWIVKNCKLSKDKYFYIGKEAYRLYKEEGYKMMATPKSEVEFD